MMQDWLLRFWVSFWGVTAEMAPWLLLGCLLAGVLHVVLPRDMIRRHLGGKSLWNVFKAVLFGVPLPLCSCGVLPTALGLKKEGAGNGATVGFLISTPQTGVDSISVSAAMLGLPFALFRVGVAFVTGILGGLATAVLAPDGVEGVRSDEAPRQGGSGTGGKIGEIAHYAFDDLLGGIWKWLLGGLLVSALLGSLLPADFFAGRSWASGWSGMFVMLALSTPLYICATGSVPVAAALVRAGLSPGCALVFLMAGPATNAATLAALYRALGRRVTVIYLSTIVIGSLLFGRAFEFLLDLSPEVAVHHHGSSGGIVHGVAAAVLLLLFLRLAWRGLSGPPRRPQAEPAPAARPVATVEVPVSGLTCDHCQRVLHRALSDLPGVVRTQVDRLHGRATVEGHGIDRAAVIQAVRQAGFEAAP
ncbi:MAG: permease [Lentisphaeria bacterium]|nr:permease [Lentisphaeria bacterium]